MVKMLGLVCLCLPCASLLVPLVNTVSPLSELAEEDFDNLGVVTQTLRSLYKSLDHPPQPDDSHEVALDQAIIHEPVQSIMQALPVEPLDMSHTQPLPVAKPRHAASDFIDDLKQQLKYQSESQILEQLQSMDDSDYLKKFDVESKIATAIRAAVSAGADDPVSHIAAHLSGAHVAIPTDASPPVSEAQRIEYLQKHDIEGKVSRAIQYVIKEKTLDPLTKISDHLKTEIVEQAHPGAKAPVAFSASVARGESHVVDAAPGATSTATSSLKPPTEVGDAKPEMPATRQVLLLPGASASASPGPPTAPSPAPSVLVPSPQLEGGQKEPAFEGHDLSKYVGNCPPELGRFDPVSRKPSSVAKLELDVVGAPKEPPSAKLVDVLQGNPTPGDGAAEFPKKNTCAAQGCDMWNSVPRNPHQMNWDAKQKRMDWASDWYKCAPPPRISVKQFPNCTRSLAFVLEDNVAGRELTGMVSDEGLGGPQRVRNTPMEVGKTNMLRLHWLVWDVHRTQPLFGPNPAIVGVSGQNDFGSTGYATPCPDLEGLFSGSHGYTLTVYALKIPSLALLPGASIMEFYAAAAGYIVGTGTRQFTFKRSFWECVTCAPLKPLPSPKPSSDQQSTAKPEIKPSPSPAFSDN